MAEPLPEPVELSIVVPVLDEAQTLEAFLTDLFDRPWVRERAEVIVADGGSGDATPAIAADFPCRVLRSDAGRARQMNAARSQSRGRYLLFLHADSRLPDEFAGEFPAGATWGFFRLALADEAPAFRVIERVINWRTRLTRVAGGDQGLYFEAGFFDALGGFPPLPLMEDIALTKLARRRAAPRIVAAPISSSSRRWRRDGVVRTVLLMWGLRLAYWLGVDPRRLQRIYYPPLND